MTRDSDSNMWHGSFIGSPLYPFAHVTHVCVQDETRSIQRAPKARKQLQSEPSEPKSVICKFTTNGATVFLSTPLDMTDHVASQQMQNTRARAIGMLIYYQLEESYVQCPGGAVVRVADMEIQRLWDRISALDRIFLCSFGILSISFDQGWPQPTKQASKQASKQATNQSINHHIRTMTRQLRLLKFIQPSIYQILGIS